MKRFLFAISIVGTLLAFQAGVTAQVSAEVALRRAIEKETVNGDLKGAIAQYEKLAQGKDRAVAAKALIHMGQCYEKLGEAEAHNAYERVLREYADQKEAVTIARSRLGHEGDLRHSGPLPRRLLCTGRGDYEANISVDGRFIAFTDYSTGDVAIRDLSSGNVKRLMAKIGAYGDSLAYAEAPTFSPDLRQVAYIWQSGGSGITPSQLRVTANEPGGKSRVLLDSNPETHYYEPLGWSPDGKSILAGVGKADRTWQLAWVSTADGALKTIKSLQWRLQGGWGIDPKLSPDGRYIAYAALAANPSKFPPATTDPKDKHIYVLAADGSSENEVVKTSGMNLSPVWTPDGKHLLFTSDRSGTTGLWSVAVENGKAAGAPVFVSSSFGAGSSFTAGVAWPMGVTRSGSYYYILEHTGLEQISVADLQPGRRNNAEIFVGIRPAWSPDGKSIAFKRHHPGGDTYDLVVHSLVTGDERTYPSELGATGSGQPIWFHDGRGILVGLAGGGSFLGSHRVDVESGEYKRITNAGPSALSPDDKTLYLLRDDGIVAFDLATGAERKILATPADGRATIALSPDGRTLALWRSDFQAKRTYIGTVGVDGSNFRELCALDFAAHNIHATAPAWTRDGQAILFVQRHENKQQIMRIPVKGGTPEFTGIESAGEIQNIDLNPDGSRIAYGSTTKALLELWALDNVLSALK